MTLGCRGRGIGGAAAEKYAGGPAARKALAASTARRIGEGGTTYAEKGGDICRGRISGSSSGDEQSCRLAGAT